MQNNKTADFYCLRKNDIISQLKTIKPVALSPYLANISRTSKAKSVLSKTKSNKKNESSDKTFKMKIQSIEQLSDKNKNLKSKQTLTKLRNKKKLKNNKSRYASNQQLKFCYLARKSSVIYERTNTSPNNRTIQTINKKAQQLRKRKYKSQFTNYIDCKEMSKLALQASKRCFTDVNMSETLKQENKIGKSKKVETELCAKKFRKGKYQLTNSSLNSNEFMKTGTQKYELSKSINGAEVAKTQSNRSIHKDNDLVAQKQMTNLQLKTKGIETELEKSIQQYFRDEGDCKVPKTNNGIEIYVSTVKTPFINTQSNINKLIISEKQSQVSGEKSENGKTKILFYDFDFGEQQESMIRKNEKPSNKNCSQLSGQHFLESQRQKVQKEHFHKLGKHVE